MSDQWVIVVVSILIGFCIGWPVGSWRVRRFYRTLFQKTHNIRVISPKKAWIRNV